MRNLILFFVVLCTGASVLANEWRTIASPTLVNEIHFANNHYYIATNAGLYIIDASSKVVQEIQKYEGIPSNRVEDVLIDADGTIWIGTYDNGVASFNGLEWETISIPEDMFFNNTLLYAIEFDNNGVLYAGTSNGILKYVNNEWVSLNTFPCWDLYKASDGRIFGGGSQPSIIENGEATELTDCPIFAYGFAAVIEDGTGNLMFAADHGNIARLVNQVWETWTYSDNTFPFHFPISDIQLDENNQLWVMSADGRVAKLEQDTWNEQSLDFGESENIRQFLLRNENEYTFGGSNELVIYNQTPTQVSLSQWFLPNATINAIVGNDGDVVVASNNMYTQFTPINLAHENIVAPNNGVFLDWLPVSSNTNPYLRFLNTTTGILYSQGQETSVFDSSQDTINGYTRYAHEDANGNLWISTTEGLYRINNGQVFMYNTSNVNGFTVDQFWAIGEDRNGHVWVSSSKDIAKWDGTQFTEFYEDSDYNFLFGGGGKEFYFDENNTMYYYSWANGLTLFDGTTFSNINITNSTIPSNQIRDLIPVEDKIYLATDEGLAIYQNGTFEVITEYNSGLLDNNCTALYQDQLSNIWIGTSQGISLYNKNGIVSNLTSENLRTENLNVYPNPFQNVLYLESDKEVLGIEIYSLDGKLMHQTTPTITDRKFIDTSSIPNGCYILRIQLANQSVTQKIMKR